MVRRFSRQTRNLHERYKEKQRVNRKKRGRYVATVATTCLRASSNDVIGGAGNASANAMGPLHVRRN